MTKASDNAFPSILVTEGTEPSAPAAGKQRLYIDSTTHKLKRTDSSGTDVTIEGGSVATDTIWDAAGDLAVGSGADTAAKLAKGAAGGALSIINAAVAWNSGTSFPGSKATGDRYWRTDLGMEFFWDGTRWLTSGPPQQISLPFVALPPVAVSSVNHRGGFPGLYGGSDIYLQSITTAFHVSGGTALSGSHKWVITYNKAGSGAPAAVATVNIDSGSSDVWRLDTQAVNAVLTAASFFEIESSYVKTGTPGSLYAVVTLGYRIVAT